MLLDRALALKAALAEHQDLKAASNQAQVFATRAAQLSAPATALSNACASWAGLKAQNVAVHAHLPLPGLRRRAEELLATFRADRAALRNADESIRFEFLPAVKKVAEEIDRLALSAWTETVDEQADLPSEDVLRALEAIPNYHSHVQRIRAVAERVNTLRSRIPDPEHVASKLAELTAARSAKDAELGTMTGDGLPAKVLRFLRAAGQQGAALSDFTEEVATWLEDRKLSDAFRIVSKRTT
ncbi:MULTISPECIES: hypothetical protein [Mesorhizobium]|uniref:hypothetical protein n=1 Tax=Mesorhizobium TaxID=68287 RepID=UPI0010A979E0|nr:MULTISPECIES: hypothetical protein [Mesorhizobium]